MCNFCFSDQFKMDNQKYAFYSGTYSLFFPQSNILENWLTKHLIMYKVFCGGQCIRNIVNQYRLKKE